MDGNYSIVHYFSEEDKHKCGYCKKLDTNAIHGMWAQCLTVQDYQDLIDRGWRRSGKYCYKPIMDITCCPMYTIKCEALNFKPSKSQKKILKRINKFLTDGVKDRDNVSNSSIERQQGGPFEMETTTRQHTDVDLSRIQSSDNLKEISNDQQMELRNKPECSGSDKSTLIEKNQRISIPVSLDTPVDNCSLPPEPTLIDPETKSSSYKPGEGVDTSKPPCKKAKLMRMERKKQKLAAAGVDIDLIPISRYQKQHEEKSLEQFIMDVPNDAIHKLKLVLKRMSLTDDAYEISARLYAKYQMAVHGETAEECNVKTFKEFLIDSPLEAIYPREGPTHGYGSFHQQYWLDENLIAVGVIDILPKCISSVYFFYDPDYSHLSLGTYGSLREIHFTRELHRIASELKYYYMGYYIHSCPKMRYKANFSPSYLLCPETYFWFPIEKCLEMLNIHPYARFNEDSESGDTNKCTMDDIKNVLILYNCTVMRYFYYRIRNRHNDGEIYEYANLVGKKCAFRMFLVQDS